MQLYPKLIAAYDKSGPILNAAQILNSDSLIRVRVPMARPVPACNLLSDSCFGKLPLYLRSADFDLEVAALGVPGPAR
jgi:hypothetical protein